MRVGLLACCLIALSACQAQTQEYITAAPPEATLPPTRMPASSTPAQPGATTAASPTPSPEPTSSEEIGTGLPVCPWQPFNLSFLEQAGEPINTGNAGQVNCLGRWGTGRIYEVDYSPDGERLAVGSSLGITLYEAETLQEIAFLSLPIDPRLGMLQPGMTDLMGFAAGGEILAVAESEKVALYRASDGSSLGVLVGDGENAPLMTLAISPDGKLVAASEGWTGDVNLWQVEGEVLVQSWTEPPPPDLTFSPDGRFLVSSNGTVRDVSDDSTAYDLGIEGCCLNEVTFSPDGRYMTGVWDQDGLLRMWRVEDGELLYTFDGYGKVLFTSDSSRVTQVSPSFIVQTLSTHDGEVLSSDPFEDPEFASQYLLSFSQDGSMLVTAAFEGAINLWDLSTGELIQTLEGHRRHVNSAQFSPDGEMLVTADDAYVRAWQISDGTLLASRQHAYLSTVLSPDWISLVTNFKEYVGLQVWDPGEGNLRYSLEETRWPLAFSENGELLATGERQVSEAAYIRDWIQVRRVSDGAPLYQLDSDDNEFDNPNYDLAFSSDGSYLAAVHDPGDIMVWRTNESLPLYRLTVDDYLPFLKAAVSPDGEYLATGNSYHSVQVWNLETGELMEELPMEATEIMGTSGAVGDLEFSPDGELLAAVDEGGFYQIWRTSDWTTLQHASDFINQYDPYRSAVGVTFSADGGLLATAGTGGAVSLWDAASGELLVSLKGHVDGIMRIGFSPDGSWLYASSLDGTVSFWGLAGE